MYIQREIFLKKLNHYREKDLIKIITGIRRCGKSVLLNNLFYDFLLQDGVPADHIIRISLDLKKWENLRDGDELYNYLKGQIKDNSLYYIFLDEIQLVDNFEDILNSIKAEFNTDIYVTGSNSKLLSNDINTIFRGRGIEIKVFPFSFQEYYAQIKGDRLNAFNEYVKFGGLPYIVNETTEDAKLSYLDMIVKTVVTRDIIERYDIRNEAMFIAVIELLCSSIGSYISTAKIANTLKSNGFKTADNETVGRYLNHICDSFLFYKVNRFDIKGKEYLKTQNKYYATDMGLRNATIQYRQLEMTHIIENICYLELLRRGYIVDIGKNRDKEIDFVAQKLSGERYYIQVSLTIADPITKERELSAFHLLDDGFKKILITMDYNPLKNLENGFRMLNLFDFLLDNEALENS